LVCTSQLELDGRMGRETQEARTGTTATLDERLSLEREWHETADKGRDENSLIVSVYSSGLFDEAEAHLLDVMGDVRGLSVLDYGCGTGGGSRELAQRGASVTGFDLSQRRLGEARAHSAPGAGLAPRYLLSAAETLPFPDACFDAVYGKQILHHLQLATAIPEIRRVLRPGGRAAFLEPLIHNPLLEGYRRRTAHLRSPSEKALSMDDLRQIGAQFRGWSHQEFCLFAVLPALGEAVTGRRIPWRRLREALQRSDRRLMGAFPALGRYAWETVIVVDR
jgi:ubiquinone/menaquinone biosynthesis C-methylase UbiE